MLRTRFTWDPRKAEKNFLNHNVSFETAKEVFQDPDHILAQNYFKDGEQREHVIGMTRGAILLLVVFVDRSTNIEDVVRIISARKAVASERSLYADQT